MKKKMKEANAVGHEGKCYCNNIRSDSS
jgi:hypothetical protein